ncbi:hypothetical protein [Cellulomonas soli]
MLGVHKELLGARARGEQAEHRRQLAALEEARARYEELAARIRTLEEQRRSTGGDLLAAIDAELRTALGERERLVQQRTRLERWCTAAQVPNPTDAAGLAAVQEQARARTAGTGDDPDARADLHTRIAAAEEAKRAIAALREELRSYEGRRSNLPAAALAVRQAVAEGVGLAEDELPFVGELLDVAAGEEQWRTAAERLLGGFGSGLLVDQEHYTAVARFVDEHDLRALVRYTPVRTDQPVQSDAPAPGTMAAKVVVADSPFAPWLREQLVRRFSHRCVQDAAELAVLREAVTIHGQVKHRAGLHEKDDRAQSRRDKVIGFDNADTVRELHETLAAREAELVDLERARDDADAAREHARTRREAWAGILTTVWDDVDTAAVDAQIAAARARRDAAASGDGLDTLEQEIAALVDARDEANHQARTAREAAARAEKAWGQRVSEEDRLGARLDQVNAPEGDQLDTLAALADRCDPDPSLDSIARLRTTMQQAVEAQVASADSAGGTARAAISSVLADFLRSWPEEAGTLTRDVDSTPAYLDLLAGLQADDLPAALAQWRQLMHSSTRWD